MSASAALVVRSTAQAFISSLVTNVAVLAIQVGAFSVLKQRMSRIYSPRTFLPPPDKKAKELPKGLWRWLPAIIMAPTNDIIHVNGLDAYLFLRYLKMLVIIFLVHTIATFAVIIPINSVNVNSGKEGINRFNWENLTLSSQQDRFSAHIILAYFLTTFVVLMIRREMMHFVFMQQRFLISKSHSRLAQARTVLITSVPDDLANEEDMRLFTSFVPGGIDRVWFFRDTKELDKLFAKRQHACDKLESAITNVLDKTTIAWRDRQARHRKAQKKKSKDEEKQKALESLPQPKPSMEFCKELVPSHRRPKHRIGFMGLLGEKVDTIDYCKEEISRLNPIVANAQKYIVKGKFLGSVFIRCNLQMGAHVLAQCISHHKPFTMYGKWIEAHPKDVVWENLAENAVGARTRTIVSWLLTLGVIVVWVFPVGFVGTLSNVSSLCSKVSSLNWICTAPTPIPGIIQGVLPPIILTIFFAVLPLIFRALAWYECIPRNTLISVSVYRRFFLFLLIHGFLIVTVSSGITNAIADIVRNPASAVKSLASRLSGASTFFLTYMVTQGLAGAGIALTQLVSVLFYYLRKVFFGRTPRQAFEVTFVMPSADFGVILPMFSLLATIGFAYSVISPLINALALLSFSCIYVAWKYLILQVLDQTNEMETSGRYHTMAMSMLFVGLYVEQFCLACLFFLKISLSRIPSIIDAVTMVVLMALTIFAHVMIHDSFQPITNYLPMTLATRKLAKRYERRKGLHEEERKRREENMINRLMSVRKRLALRKHRVDDPHKPSLRLELDHDIKDIKDVDCDVEQVEASGSSVRPRAPELFRHLSVPDEDKHDEYNRRKSPTTSRPASIIDETNGDVDVEAQRPKPTEAHGKPEAVGKQEEKFNVAGDDPDEGDDDDAESQDEADFDEHAFDHPSTYKEQRCIWIPKDELGLSRVFVQDLTDAGIIVSDDGAVMDEEGNVEVSRGPPDEEWNEGMDR